MIYVRGIDHVAIICSDIERSVAFYVDVLGCEVKAQTYRKDRQSHKVDLVVGHRQMLELFTFPNPPERLSYPEARGLRHLALSVWDIQEARAYIESKRIACQEMRYDTLTGRPFFFIHDPDGLPIEIVGRYDEAQAL